MQKLAGSIFLMSCVSGPIVKPKETPVVWIEPTVVSQAPPLPEPATSVPYQPAFPEPEEFVEDTADDCSDELLEPAIPRGENVLLVGDSLAVGMSKEFKVLAGKSGYVPYSHAVIGSTTSQWITWIKKDLERIEPKLVVVSLGTNDAAAFESVRRNPEMFKEFAKIVEETDAFLVWIGPPAISRRKIDKIEDVRDLVKSAANIYYPSEDLSLRLGDGIHADATGYKQWITDVWEWMSVSMIVYDSQ